MMRVRRISMVVMVLAGAVALHGLTTACVSPTAYAGNGGSGAGTHVSGAVYTSECDPAKSVATVELPGLSVQEIVRRTRVYGSLKVVTSDLPGATSMSPFLYGFADGKIIANCSNIMSGITVILD